MSVYKVDFSVANGIWVEDRLRTDMTVWFSWSASSHPAYVHPSIHGVCKSLRPSTIYQPLYWFYLNITFHHFSLINCLPLPNEINQEFHKYSARSALMDVFFFFAFFFFNFLFLTRILTLLIDHLLVMHNITGSFRPNWMHLIKRCVLGSAYRSASFKLWTLSHHSFDLIRKLQTLRRNYIIAQMSIDLLLNISEKLYHIQSDFGWAVLSSSADPR